MSSSSASRIPATGLPKGVETGPLGKRFVALLIDSGVPAVLILLTSVISGAIESGSGQWVVTVLGTILVAAWLIVVCWMYATKAAGPGMRLMKLQLVGLRDGRAIGWGRFVGRQLVLALLSVTVVGLILLVVVLLQHPRKQGWHDLLADSVVIKQRALAPTSPSRPPTKEPARALTPVPHPSSEQQPSAPPASPVGPAVTAVGASPLSTADSVRMRPRRAAAPAPLVTDQGPAPVTSPVLQNSGAKKAAPIDGRPLGVGWVAVLDDDREVEILGLVLLGRNPQARPGEDDAELIKVADDTRTVSKTHLSLAVDDDGLFVIDRGSTNGTTLTDPVGVSRSCPAGDVVSVRAGSIISFGDHWLKVERRP